MGGGQSNKKKQVCIKDVGVTPGSDLKRLYHVSRKPVGVGAFAKVYKGRSLANPHFKVAIKSFKKGSK